MRLNTSPPGVIPPAIKPISGPINHLQKQEKKKISFSSQHLICSNQGSSGSIDWGRAARCFSSLGVWRPSFGSAAKSSSVCEELQVKCARVCASSGSWARWQSSCVARVLCSGASAGWAPRTRSSHGIHWGSIWQPWLYIYCVGAHVLHASSLCHRTNIYAPIIRSIRERRARLGENIIPC